MTTTAAFSKTYNPAGGWQWAGLYVPSGNVYIGDMSTNDVREYDAAHLRDDHFCRDLDGLNRLLPLKV